MRLSTALGTILLLLVGCSDSFSAGSGRDAGGHGKAGGDGGGRLRDAAAADGGDNSGEGGTGTRGDGGRADGTGGDGGDGVAGAVTSGGVGNGGAAATGGSHGGSGGESSGGASSGGATLGGASGTAGAGNGGTSGSGGATASGGANAGGVTGNGGVNTGGSTGTLCTTVAQCTKPLLCEPCANGSISCAVAACVKNRCIYSVPSCSADPTGASCAPTGNCKDGPSCGNTCCPAKEWCDTSGPIPVCRCGSGGDCQTGAACVSNIGSAECGFDCCPGLCPP